MVTHRIVLINEYIAEGLPQMGRQMTTVGASTSKAAVAQQKLSKGVGDVTTKSKPFLRRFTEMRWVLVNLAMAAAVAYGGFKLFIQPAIELETEMANVRKTTGYTSEAIDKLSDDLVDLSTILPVTAIDLAKIAAIAGQLGLGGQGAEAIRQFTTVIAMMTTATGMSAEEAAKGLAKISNAFQIPISDVAGLANVINELENTTAATAEDLINSLTRVGAAATGLGVSFETSSAALATLIAAGMRPQRAGTRLRRLFQEMSTDLEGFAKIAGVSTARFRTLLETDADEALRMVILNIKDMSDAYEAAGGVGGFALMTLAKNQDDFSDSLEIANEQLKKQDSLLKETAIKAETTAGQWQKLKNQLQEPFLGRKGWITILLRGFRSPIRPKKELLKAWEEYEIAAIKAGKSGVEIIDIWEKAYSSPSVVDAIDYLKVATKLVTDELEQQGKEAEETGTKVETVYESLEKMMERWMAARAAVDDVEGKSAETIQDEIQALDELKNLIVDVYGNKYPRIISALEKLYDYNKKTAESTDNLSDATRVYRLRISELQRELRDVGDELSDVREDINKINDAISNILGRRWRIAGIGETDVTHLIRQQEIELLRAQFAAMGLGTAEEFLRNATIITTDEIESQTEAVRRLIAATEDGQDQYDAWRNALSETIRELLISSQDIDRDVTSVVRRAQTELLSITRFDRERGTGFDTMESNLDALRMAQELFFGEEQEQLRYSEALREDRINGVNQSAAQAISNLSTEREALKNLMDEEDRWIRKQGTIRDEIDKNRLKIEQLTASMRGLTTSYLGGLVYGEWGESIRYRAGGEYHFTDFISRPGEPIRSFSPQDTIIGVKEPEKVMGSSINININGYNRDPKELATEIKRQMASLA